MDEKFEKLKEILFSKGNECIEEFLGYAENIEGMSREEIEELMNDNYSQMPEEILEEFYQRFDIE